MDSKIKHIAFTQRHLDSGNGGEERSLFSIINYLSKNKNVKLSLFYKNKGDFNIKLAKNISQFQTLEEEFSIRNSILFLISLLKTNSIIKREKITHIHVNHYKDITWAACVKKLTGIKLTLHLRLNAPEYLSRQYKWGLNLADGFVANSAFVKKDWLKYLKNEKIEVIYNGIDLQEDKNDPIIDAVDLLFIGRLVHEKGLHLIIKALSKLPKHRTLTILGDFRHSEERGESNFELEILDLISELNLESRVRFKGQVSNPFTFINASSIVIVPSYHDSFGRTFMEAWSLGVPVIASYCGGMIELCEKHTQLKEFTFEEGNWESLAECLLKNELYSPFEKVKSIHLSFLLDDTIKQLNEWLKKDAHT